MVVFLFLFTYWVTNTQSYVVIEQSMDFASAKLYCEQTCNSSLVSVHSQSEYDSLLSIAIQYWIHKSSVNLWIGLFRLADDTSEWFWTDLTDFDWGNDVIGGAYPWSSGQPDDADFVEDCVLIYNNDRLWNDDKCDSINIPFICNTCNQASIRNKQRTECIEYIYSPASNTNSWINWLNSTQTPYSLNNGNQYIIFGHKTTDYGGARPHLRLSYYGNYNNISCTFWEIVFGGGLIEIRIREPVSPTDGSGNYNILTSVNANFVGNYKYYYWISWVNLTYFKMGYGDIVGINELISLDYQSNYGNMDIQYIALGQYNMISEWWFDVKCPTFSPTKTPTANPSTNPSMNPSTVPSINPSVHPTDIPSESPTYIPSLNPTMFPSTFNPTSNPTTLIPTTLNPTTLNPTNGIQTTIKEQEVETTIGVTKIEGTEDNKEIKQEDDDQIIIIIIVGIICIVILIVFCVILCIYRKTVNRKLKNESMVQMETGKTRNDVILEDTTNIVNTQNKGELVDLNTDDGNTDGASIAIIKHEDSNDHELNDELLYSKPNENRNTKGNDSNVKNNDGSDDSDQSDSLYEKKKDTPITAGNTTSGGDI